MGFAILTEIPPSWSSSSIGVQQCFPHLCTSFHVNNGKLVFKAPAGRFWVRALPKRPAFMHAWAATLHAHRKRRFPSELRPMIELNPLIDAVTSVSSGMQCKAGYVDQSARSFPCCQKCKLFEAWTTVRQRLNDWTGRWL